MPTVREWHELNVSVDGQQVSCSPFPVLFPNLLLNYVNRHVGAGPSGVTVNSVGEISYWMGNVITFDREGNRLRCVKHKLCIYLV